MPLLGVHLTKGHPDPKADKMSSWPDLVLLLATRCLHWGSVWLKCKKRHLKIWTYLGVLALHHRGLFHKRPVIELLPRSPTMQDLLKQYAMGVMFMSHITGLTVQWTTINFLGNDFIVEYLNLGYNWQMNWGWEDKRNPEMTNYWYNRGSQNG